MKETRKNIGYWGATSTGVGGMVAGGIFAVLGLAVQLARGATPIAFGVTGFIALITAYSYARLSVARPSKVGTVTFLDWAFGPGILTGSLNILLWLSYIVMISLYAYAFGSYGASFFPRVLQPLWRHVLVSTVVIAVTGLNMIGAGLVAKAETWIVAAQVTILFLFIGLGLRGVSPSRIASSTWSSPLHLVVGGMIIFLAYEGFELIANIAPELRQPKTTLPRALFSSVLFVSLLYVLVAIVAMGNLSLDAIIAAKDYALAEAATPFLGDVGFSLIVAAALFSTMFAINTILYGATRLSLTIAKDGELPRQLAKEVWNEPLEGLLITSGLALFVANAFDLSSISVMGSAGFLIIFAAVNIANFRLHKLTTSSRWISALGAGACAGAFLALIWYTVHYSPQKLGLLALMLLLAISAEFFYRSWARRAIHLSADDHMRERSNNAGGEDSGERPNLGMTPQVTNPSKVIGGKLSNSKRGPVMSIDMNNPNEFTLANVRQLIASGDTTKATQLRVSSCGFLGLAPPREEQGIDDIAFQFAPWSPKDKKVGPGAAEDDQWVLRVYKVLRENWPHPSTKLIDIRD